jgi:hypothetical protein
MRLVGMRVTALRWRADSVLEGFYRSLAPGAFSLWVKGDT